MRGAWLRCPDEARQVSCLFFTGLAQSRERISHVIRWADTFPSSTVSTVPFSPLRKMPLLI